MFPRTAVDEWGFVSEENREKLGLSQAAAESQLLGNIQRFAEWRKVWKEYERSVGQVAHRAVETSLLHLAKKNFAGGDPADSQAGRLAVVNLAFAWKSLLGMQAEFRKWFGRYVAEQKLKELEQHEDATFRHLWPVAYAVVYAPDAGSNGVSRLEVELRERRREFLRRLRPEVNHTLGPNGTATWA